MQRTSTIVSAQAPLVLRSRLVASRFAPAILLLTTILLSGCTESQLDRLDRIGKAPDMKPIENPTEKKDYHPVSWPTQKLPDENSKPINSLWQTGSRTFFRDPRARNVGDILRVKVSIADSAKLNNSTTANRTTAEALATPDLFGMQKKIYNILPGSTDPSSPLSVKGSSTNTGTGNVARQEAISTVMAALVTQVLPNGNLVIQGQQQIRVNNESRILSVQGVIRPEDISSDNIVTSDQIAEARIAYGGEGSLSDLQQPRIGSQILDILSPF